MTLNLLIHNAAHGPSVFYAGKDSASTDASCLRPLASSHSLAVVLNPSVVPPVKRLFLSRCPSAVLLVVALIIVNTLNAISSNGNAHIVDKIDEAVFANPPIAHYDSTSSVMTVTRIALVKASPFHSSPYSVYPGIGKPMNHRRSSEASGVFPPKASAGSGSSVKQTPLKHRGNTTTVAKAFPESIFLELIRLGNNNESTKPASDKVFLGDHPKTIAGITLEVNARLLPHWRHVV